MTKKKNLTKAKKIRKQLLAASAAGLVLVSNAASTGTSLVYAAEKNQPATIEKSEKNTKNLEMTSKTTASFPQAASNKP
ncbi:hypothetical protein, partial [Enterococcus ratti]